MNWLNSILHSITGFFAALSIGWVDFLTIIVLGIGIIRGRKRGLSEEILDTVQWILIIVVGAFFYHVLADILNQRPLLSLASFCIISYILIAIAFKIVFTFIKKRFGQKLIESDVFGRLEFYGGMGAGVVRWLCMYFFLISIIHAPYFSPEELAKRKKDVEYNYGSDFFPSVDKIQASVFRDSLTGKGADKYLGRFLLEPASTDTRNLRGDSSLAKRRERAVDEAFGGK